MLFNTQVQIKSKRYWQNKLYTVDIDFNLWFKCNFTSDITPRNCLDFNWKLFHGQVNTEQKLVKMKFSNGCCKLCVQHEENLDHLLIDCNQTKEIWQSIQHIITKAELGVKVSKYVIIVGVLSLSLNSQLVNMILSICRFTVWKRRNQMKFEGKFIDLICLKKWILCELKSHISALLHIKIIEKKKDLKEKLQQVLRIVKDM